MARLSTRGLTRSPQLSTARAPGSSASAPRARRVNRSGRKAFCPLLVARDRTAFCPAGDSFDGVFRALRDWRERAHMTKTRTLELLCRLREAVRRPSRSRDGAGRPRSPHQGAGARQARLPGAAAHGHEHQRAAQGDEAGARAATAARDRAAPRHDPEDRVPLARRGATTSSGSAASATPSPRRRHSSSPCIQPTTSPQNKDGRPESQPRVGPHLGTQKGNCLDDKNESLPLFVVPPCCLFFACERAPAPEQTVEVVRETVRVLREAGTPLPRREVAARRSLGWI